MEDWQKMVLTISGVALIFFWSGWFWTNFPAEIKTESQIEKECNEKEKMSEYCFGYRDGYEWAVKQVEMQKQIDEAMDEIQSKQTGTFEPSY